MAVAHGRRIDIVGGARVLARMQRQVLRHVAGVPAVVQRAGSGDRDGGSANCGHRNLYRQQARDEVVQHLSGIRLALPQIAAGEKQQLHVFGTYVGKRKIGDDAQAAHGHDGIRRESNGTHRALAPPSELGERVRGLPIGEAVEDENVDCSRRFHGLSPHGKSNELVLSWHRKHSGSLSWRCWPPLANHAMKLVACLLLPCVACATETRPSWDVAQDSTQRLASISGLSGPEAMRYDPNQDVYFISNFNGAPAGDSNGFIARVRADATIDSLHFMVGTPTVPLHGPRGMFLTADTLWVADADGVHLFHRRTGAQLGFVDFKSFAPGFLNDIAQGPDGAIYITDTGRSRVYRIAGRTPTIAIEDSATSAPNGITWDASHSRFLLASWSAAPPIHEWDGQT